MSINQDTLHEFLGKAIVDFGATFNAALIRIGDRLGLYKALAKSGPQTPAQLATATGTSEPYIPQWLSEQAAGGYVTYDAKKGTFHLSEEQAFAMADEIQPCIPARRFSSGPRGNKSGRADRRAIQDRRRHGLARTSP